MAKRKKRSWTIKKRSISIDDHKTSVTLEDEFWKSLKMIAYDRNKTVSQLITRIDANRQFFNLSSAIRVYVLRYFRDKKR